jgi:multimeric flavodoxin WrbA
VAPLYFAGPPAQLKALYDRMQPYWAQRYLLGVTPPVKRPAQLFVVGGGGDEHGYTPLTTITKSSLAVAGFNLEKVNNFIGFASPKDAAVYPAASELEHYSHAELAKLRRATSEQAAFAERALDSGGAFARYVVKKKEACVLAAQLAEVEAELKALNAVGDAVSFPGDAAAQPGSESTQHLPEMAVRPASDGVARHADFLGDPSGSAPASPSRLRRRASGGSSQAARLEHQAEVEFDYRKLIVSVEKGEE